MSFTVEDTPLEGVSTLQATLLTLNLTLFSLILDNRLWIQSVPWNMNQEYYWESLFYFYRFPHRTVSAQSGNPQNFKK